MAGGDGANAIENIFCQRRAGDGMDDDIGIGQNVVDGPGDFIGDLTGALEGDVAGEADGNVGEVAVAGAANADAVDLCVAQIHSANACGDFLTVSRVFQIDDEADERNALVTAEVEMIVLSPFAVCSPVASSCTGTCWDAKSANANAKASPASRDSFPVSHRLRVEKAFAFQKTDNGWRCTTAALQPVDFGVAVSGR